MVENYGKGRDQKLARIGYQNALRVLAEGIANGKSASFEKQLAKAVETKPGRLIWSMMYPIVANLLIGGYKLFRKADVPGNPVANANARRPCYVRDHLWLKWHDEEGLGIAAIRDRWNRECGQHGGRSIGKGRPGRDVVKEGLRKAREERAKKA